MKEDREVLKRLVRHGNSLALIIDKPILELLRIDADTELELFSDGKSLWIVPVVDGKVLNPPIPPERNLLATSIGDNH